MVSTRRQKASELGNCIDQINKACATNAAISVSGDLGQSLGFATATASLPSPPSSVADVMMKDEPSPANDSGDNVPESTTVAIKQEASSDTNALASATSTSGRINFSVSKPGATVRARVRVTKKVIKKEVESVVVSARRPVAAARGIKRGYAATGESHEAKHLS